MDDVDDYDDDDDDDIQRQGHRQGRTPHAGSTLLCLGADRMDSANAEQV